MFTDKDILWVISSLFICLLLNPFQNGLYIFR